jgi:uncharacterized protein (UPF0248 family)
MMAIKQELLDKLRYNEQTADDEYEICIICHRETDVKKSTPVDKRKYYVEGFGQMCRECYMKSQH